ncbi:MAG: hypothetical protein E6G44_09740 [Actinobacteria bacterium]|nr:MAG: hypothetical protein E6G44_09740 [Actinomycetota bacterium]
MATDPNKEQPFRPTAAQLAGNDASGTSGLPKPGTELGSAPETPGGPHLPAKASKDEGEEDEG